MIRRFLFVATIGALLIALSVANAQASAPTPTTAGLSHSQSAVAGSAAFTPVALTPAALSDCHSGFVCFWTGLNFTGMRCQYQNADSNDTTSCSWADTTNVKSIYNHGTSPDFTGVAYYKGVGYTTRAGCTRQGMHGNLAGTYKVRSHQWITGSCG